MKVSKKWLSAAVAAAVTVLVLPASLPAGADNPVLTVATTSLANDPVDHAYPSTKLTATGGTGTLTWSLANGALPTGMKLAPTGVVSGTPTSIGTFTFTVGVHDASKPTPLAGSSTLSLTITPMTITTTSTPLGFLGEAYTLKLTESGGKAPLVYKISSGALPPGMKLSTAGVISGTPTEPFTFDFTVQLTDSSKPTPNIATTGLFLLIEPMFILSQPLPAAFIEQAYKGQIVILHGKSPWVFTVVSGALPAGIKMSSSTGILTGTPTTIGTSTFTVQVTDATHNVATQAMTITVNPMSITTTTLAAAAVGKAYTAKLAVSGGKTTYAWKIVSGALPFGLKLATTGTISGTPTATGVSTFTVQVTDGTKPTPNVATATVTIAVN
jgi:large repetitive protein